MRRAEHHRTNTKCHYQVMAILCTLTRFDASADFSSLTHNNTLWSYMNSRKRINALMPSNRHAFRNNLKAQYAFSILLIRGILPFTTLIAFCCVLHRYSSRGIHR